MSVKRRLCVIAVLAIAPLSVAPSCLAQTPETLLTIELQRPPNNMEPVKEPRSIRVDDRSSVRLRLVYISPLDFCSLSSRTPTPTQETFPLEALVTSISALFAAGSGGGAATQPSTAAQQMDAIVGWMARPEVLTDPVYRRFATAANQLAAPAGVPGSVKATIEKEQEIQRQLDDISRGLIAYAAADYRGSQWSGFRPGDLNNVRQAYTDPIKSIEMAAANQATFDEMTTWAAYLHKKFDASYDPDPARDRHPSDADVAGLQKVDAVLGHAKAGLSIVADNNTALKAAQTALRTAHMALIKVFDDFQRRRSLNIVNLSVAGILYQDFLLGTDRKTTITGILSCVSSADGKPTTDQINYSILYQDVPRLTFSAGLVTTFLEKKIIGTENVAAPNGALNTIFAVTDRAQEQVFPMAYLNYRIGGYGSHLLGRTHENEWVVTSSITGGFGINPNSGTNQPEFFLGPAIGLNKLMIHGGLHYGRLQSLGGGYVENSMVPVGFMGSAPITWAYHWAVAIGFSVRLAPY